MKYIMMSTLLMILGLFFSCTNANQASDNDQEIISVQVESTDIANEVEFVGEETSDDVQEEQIVNRISKRFLKKSPQVKPEQETNNINSVENQVAKRFVKDSSDNEKVEIEQKSEWPIEKQINEMQSSSAIANDNVKVDESTAIIEEKKKNVVVANTKADHGVFNTLLSKHVSSSGVVNYKGFKSDLSKLNSYLDELAENTVASDWSRNEKLAYWINVYNAFTIKLILNHYPVKSIQDIEGGKPWDLKWIKLGEETYSLNQIENNIIRPEFKEPRIHFAVNCAAQSCPPLANKAYTASNLEGLLEQQTKAFINNSKYNTIREKSVTISKIFDWYGVDFGDKIEFLNRYSNIKISPKAKIDYTEYDWSLNNQ